MPKTYIHKM